MKRKETCLCLCLLMILFIACSGEKKKEDSEKGVETVLPDIKNEVTVIPLRKQVFNHELVSNGKVAALGFADLHFQTAEVIVHIWVKNGDKVRKGQKLAELDKFRLGNKLLQAKNALEKARLELQDVLIGQGYAAKDFEKVPDATMKLAKVKSGYDQSKADYDLALYEEQHATLVAPFDGTVANLFSKPMNVASTANVFCTLMDTRSMEVDFSVLESELPLLKKGDKVQITPFADVSALHEGSIAEINPLVDDKGMVKVRARVNGNAKLFNGMNVRVSVHRSLGEQLVIPKSAVVLRSGKQVVFTLKDGKAMWNYIHTALENADSYSIADGLNEGDTVIVAGNINLAHEAPVSVVKNLQTGRK